MSQETRHSRRCAGSTQLRSGGNLPADNSMLGKRQERVAPVPPSWRKLTGLWTKLHCLKLWFVLLSRAAQSLRAVTNQPTVGCVYRGGSCRGSKKCSLQGGGPSEARLTGLHRISGRPKGPTPTSCRLRWPKGTEGSPSLPPGRALACPKGNEGDGGPIVPQRVPSSEGRPGQGRGPGKSGERKGDVTVPVAPPSSPLTPSDMVRGWKSREHRYKGVEVPRKFAKVLERGRKDPRSTFDSLYPLLLDRRMYDIAYHEVRSNPGRGRMTPGSTGESLSGWGPEAVEKIIKSLSDESFAFAVARTTKIPKATGGTRTLRIASPKDKIVQRILAYILEAIYEPSFSEHSFGFRPGRGVHDALQYTKSNFKGIRWVIEGDISKCFDEIDHHLLVEILRRRIKDERFIRLIWKALRAGFLSDWGVPQDCLVVRPHGSPSRAPSRASSRAPSRAPSRAGGFLSFSRKRRDSRERRTSRDIDC